MVNNEVYKLFYKYRFSLLFQKKMGYTIANPIKRNTKYRYTEMQILKFFFDFWG